MRTLTATLIATALALHASAALACFPYVVSFDAATPADGATDVPVDGAVALSWTTNWAESQSGCLGESELGLVVRDDTTQDVIPGTLVRWNGDTWCSGTATVLWQPNAAMPAGRAMSISVNPQQAVSGLPDPSWTSTFTTGQATIPPLAVDGTLEVALDVVWEPSKSCMQPAPCGGGGGCTDTSSYIVRASVKLTDAIAGGQAALGYEVDVQLGADAPPTFDAAPPGDWLSRGSVFTPTGEPGYATMRVPARGAPYVPCFAAVVRDASGKVGSPQPICLAEVDPEAMLADVNAGDAGADAQVIPPGSDAGGQDSDVDPPNSDPGAAAETSGSDGGCSVAAPSTGAGWLAAAVGLLALAAFSRRRR